jgi:hypothetical protein
MGVAHDAVEHAKANGKSDAVSLERDDVNGMRTSPAPLVCKRGTSRVSNSFAIERRGAAFTLDQH